ncbi:hypothetical protein EON65_37915 [archaeon]|nr:MAG: hypothetical protein EON65_37915 [archaeon]
MPRAFDLAPLAPPSQTDFVSRNRVEAVVKIPSSKQLVPAKSKTALEPRHEEYGQVPQYLQQRREQWEADEDAKRRNAPDPDCPPGMKLMPEQERLQTLEVSV